MAEQEERLIDTSRDDGQMALTERTPVPRGLAELLEANERLLIAGLREQELAESLEIERAQLAVILANMGDAVLVVDHAGTIVRANAAYARLAGGADVPLAAEDEQGRPLALDHELSMWAGRDDTFSLQFTLQTEDGSRSWFEANGQAFGDHGAKHTVIVVRNTTLFIQHRRLQDNFLALAAHELRTPLTSIQGNLELLELRCQTADDTRVLRTIAQANHQARRLALLVDDLMDVARLQTGKLTLTESVVDLAALATEAVETSRALAGEHRINLDAPTGPLRVRGDADRLEQVLLNMLTNAIQHTLPTTHIDVQLRGVAGDAVLAVHDNGPGIADDVLPHLFERFYQVARSSRGSQGGMGLGLFICHQLVEAHGGQLTVASAKGEGTTFTVRLPLLLE